MTLFLRCLAAAGLAAMLAFSTVALADGPENLEADARLGSGNPPTIPHRVADDATSESCKACHETGIKGAPITSHPDRMGCMQCHVQGKVKKTVKKSRIKTNK